MFRKIALVLFLFFAGNASLFADPLPQGFSAHQFNGPNAPLSEGDVTTFQLFDRACSSVDYGDGRGETDCLNGNVRSTLYERDWRNLGDTATYSFSLWIEPDLSYQGWLDGDSQGFEPDSWNSKLRLAVWQGPLLHNFLYMLKADARNGVSFLGRQCQAPSDFGTRVDFSMRIRWADDERGWIKVMCDDRIIYADEAVATNQAPHCYDTNQCEPGVFKNPIRFQFEVGAVMGGYGHNWKQSGHDAPFVEIADRGITIRMGDISSSTGGELYTEDDRAVVLALQQELNALGCDVGTPDGVVGPRTRDMAQTCRRFRASVSPGKLTVANVGHYLDLYRSEPRTLTPPRIEAVEQHAAFYGQSVDMQSDFAGTAFVDGQDPLPFQFRLMGRYLPDGPDFRRLRLVLPGDLGDAPPSLTGCPDAFVDRWDDGTSHAAINIRLLDGVFGSAGTDCMLGRLPPDVRDSAEFVLFNFAKIAKSMAEDGSLEAAQHDGIRAFLAGVASGELAIKLL